MQSEKELEELFSSTLNCQLALCISNSLAPLSSLSTNEKLALAEMKHERRRDSWLKGRLALKSLISRFATEFDALRSDTTQLQVPHPNLSLTHCDEFAVAVACLESRGLGVDIEGGREIKEATTKFFLSKTENGLLNGTDIEKRQDDLLRLWTVKESLFKSDLYNKEKTMLKYQVADPNRYSGSAQNDESRQFHYSSLKFGKYWLTVAVANGGKEHD